MLTRRQFNALSAATLASGCVPKDPSPGSVDSGKPGRESAGQDAGPEGGEGGGPPSGGQGGGGPDAAPATVDSPAADAPGDSSPSTPTDAAGTSDASDSDTASSAEPVVERLVFGSCNRLEFDQSFWAKIIERDPQYALFLGDSIYVDHGDTYAKLSANAGLKQLLTRTRPLAIWDDHDFGGNDTGASYKDKAGAKKRFLDFWIAHGAIAPDSPRIAREGNYDAVVLGPPGRQIQIIMLDNRTWKGNPPNGQVLGDAQWAWLAEELRKPARLRLVMSGMELISSSMTPEGWGLFLAEQQRFYDTIKAAQAKAVIVLSGDKHFAEISRRDVGLGYPLYDFTSSPFSAPPEALEMNKYRDTPDAAISTYNFGLITVDWSAADPSVHVQLIHATEGKVLLERMLSLSQLGG